MTHAATRWLVPLGAAALLLPIARDANACSPWDPALDRTFEQDPKGPHPARHRLTHAFQAPRLTVEVARDHEGVDGPCLSPALLEVRERGVKA
jgi:hypothetical protein